MNWSLLVLRALYHHAALICYKNDTSFWDRPLYMYIQYKWHCPQGSWLGPFDWFPRVTQPVNNGPEGRYRGRRDQWLQLCVMARLCAPTSTRALVRRKDHHAPKVCIHVARRWKEAGHVGWALMALTIVATGDWAPVMMRHHCQEKDTAVTGANRQQAPWRYPKEPVLALLAR